jgi:hypothetical protein
MAADFFFRLGDGFRQVLEQIENSPVSQEVIDALIPKPNFK